MAPTKFAALSRLLTDLGFARRNTPTAIRFDHAEANAWFVYPSYGDDEEVMPTDLVGTRHLLDAKGLLARDQFEERLKTVLVAG